MNVWVKGLLALLLFGVTSGCITTQAQVRMEQDLEEMKRRLSTIERRAAAKGEEQSQQAEERLDKLARRQADLQAGLDSLQVELQSMNGRLEDMRQERSTLREDLALVQDDMSLKLAAMEDRVSDMEARLAEPPEVPTSPESAEELYRRGVDEIQQDDHAAGRQIMTEFLERFPEHDLVPNAMYWTGEAYYGEKKYENAILQFQDVIQEHGDHQKASAALLKQGLAFRALGDEKNARIILEKTTETYPESEEAEKARKKLREWGES